MSAPTISPARTIAIDYDQLTPGQQTAFTAAMDTAGDTVDNTTYFLVQAAAASAIGIDLPSSGELALCTCPMGCHCALIHDAAQTRTYTEGATEIVQCPDCADDHRYGDPE